MENKEKKVLLSLKNVEVKFNVRGRILTAIRNVSLDVYENESLAIVGESGSGKSVLTKTFAGMLDSNGFISNGTIQLNDEELADTVVNLHKFDKILIKNIRNSFDKYSRFEYGAETYNKIQKLKAEEEAKETLSDDERKEYDAKLNDLQFKRTEAFNLRQTLDSKNDRDKYKEVGEKIEEYDKQIRELENEIKSKIKANADALKHDAAYKADYVSGTPSPIAAIVAPISWPGMTFALAIVLRPRNVFKSLPQKPTYASLRRTSPFFGAGTGSSATSISPTSGI